MKIINGPWPVDKGNKKPAYFGLFYCPKCKTNVVKQTSNGKVSKTCGCGRHDHKKKHGACVGYKDTKLYKVWSGIRSRCRNKNNQRYKHYGGRGIAFCEEWQKYEPFRDWALLNGYKEYLSIDRRNNDGNYTPENCRFITLTDNNRNKKNNVLSIKKAEKIRSIYAEGEHSQRELAKMFGVHQWRIWKVLKNEIWVTD